MLFRMLFDVVLHSLGNRLVAGRGSARLLMLEHRRFRIGNG